MHVLRYRHWISCMCCTLFFTPFSLQAFVAKAESFRAVLQSTGIETDTLSELGAEPDLGDDQWQLLSQLFRRLAQFRDLAPALSVTEGFPPDWQHSESEYLGELIQLHGVVTAIEQVPVPQHLANVYEQDALYRCSVQLTDTLAIVLSTHIPKDWSDRQIADEPVKLRGVLVGMGTTQPLLVTDHLAWYPTANVSTGKLLLARHGMDVALLDEVVHGQPFVKPEISREGEAFYAALVALAKVDPAELARLATENVGRVAEQWRLREPELLRRHRSLETQMAATTDADEKQTLQRDIKQAKNQRGLAAAVLKQANEGRSSVAPMFLQPDQEVGELYTFEGTARRAVRIPTTGQAAIDAYYEVEVFTLDSQNLPVVCCLTQLPVGFPEGDQIREPVQITGLFFKQWRYRSRQLVDREGVGGSQRAQYAPILVSQQPVWLRQATSATSRWPLWGGLAFLAVLAMLWVYLTGLSRRDRRARTRFRPQVKLDLE